MGNFIKAVGTTVAYMIAVQATYFVAVVAIGTALTAIEKKTKRNENDMEFLARRKMQGF